MGDPLPYQVLLHEDYVEVRFEGVLDGALSFDDAALESVVSLPRVLLDYTGVTEINADAYVLAERARKGEAQGLKVAIYAPRPALFGLSRQALQLGGVREGVSVGVFSDLESARTWLMAS